MRADLLVNGASVSSGIQRCVKAVTRNAAQAKEAIVTWDPLAAPVPLGDSDVVSVQVSTRIGTNADDTSCGGHGNATGLRLCYDAATRRRGSRASTRRSSRPPTPTSFSTPTVRCVRTPRAWE